MANFLKIPESIAQDLICLRACKAQFHLLRKAVDPPPMDWAADRMAQSSIATMMLPDTVSKLLQNKLR